MRKQRREQRRGGAIRAFFRFIQTIIFLIGLFFLLMIALLKAMQQKELRDWIRHFNQKYLNPQTLKIAGNRSGVYASIQHVGRHSGKAYSTPVVARPFGEGFIIPLPYGQNVDWCKNVVAAGKCTLRWNEQEYTLEKPEIITLAEAMKAFSVGQRIIFAAGGMKQCLKLQQQKLAPEEAAVGV